MKKPTKAELTKLVADLTEENATLKQQLGVAVRKPATVQSLEALLKADEDAPLRIMPNGEIRAMTDDEVLDKKFKPITMKEDLGGEYARILL